jgi:transglutaminase-like putative cysteine protease
MTAEPRRLRLPAAPEEGWTTLVLVIVMALMMAASIDDAGWVLEDSHLTDFLGIATLGGVFAGFIGAKVGWNRWLAHTFGAIFAALLVPILVGDILEPGQSIGYQFVATADDAAQAWYDLVIVKLPLTRATGHHLVILGLLCWGTAQFASSAVFRHHRPLSAVVVIGAVLVANMAATTHENQIWFLIVFSIASLLLLTRLHALDEQATWTRRRIGDPAAVRSLYLRGGAVFIAVAVVSAFVLTATARSKPLEGAWEDFKPWLLDVSSSIQRFLPTLEDSRGIGGVRFGPSATILGTWNTDSGLAMTVERTAGDNFPYYWRVVTFDYYNDLGWNWKDPPGTKKYAVPDGDEILAGSGDRVLSPGTKDVTFRVTPFNLQGSYAVSPLAPLAIDRPSEVEATSVGSFFQALEIDGRDPYTITTRVPLRGDKDGGQTQNKLRVAGTSYPSEILARYLQLTPGAVGPEAKKVLADAMLKLTANGLTENPYDIADSIRAELSSRRFAYDPTVRDIHAQCGELSVSECFATYKRGYCEHYATLMTVLLREKGIPARFVEGFLPGELNRSTGVEQVPNAAAHAWTEVFFPGTGWVAFDSTPSSVSEVVPLPTGAAQTPKPSRIPSLAPNPFNDDLPSRSPGSAATTGARDGGIGPGGFILIGLVLASAIVIAIFLLWRRGPRGVITPEGAWLSIARLAGRFGYGPRPTQTTYEYATALGETLPGIRPQLETVATAKVEVTYGGRVLGDDRLQAIRDAYSKLRIGLLRLLFRRPRRRRRG